MATSMWSATRSRIDARTFASDGSADRTATPPGASTPYSPAEPDRMPRPEIPGTNANQPDDEERISAERSPWRSRRDVTGGRPDQDDPSPRAIAMRSARTALLVLAPPAPGPSTAMRP